MEARAARDRGVRGVPILLVVEAAMAIRMDTDSPPNSGGHREVYVGVRAHLGSGRKLDCVWIAGVARIVGVHEAPDVALRSGVSDETLRGLVAEKFGQPSPTVLAPLTAGRLCDLKVLWGGRM